ncbi:hypothetical protein KS884_004614, partial [Vibrio parahaemolyticus]|nr:hypothetical protein [Vibrio parahaemolyticus]
NMEFDYIDGQKVPQTYIDEDFELVGTHDGTVHVISGVFKLLGTLRGTLDIKTEKTLEILGNQQGTVSLSNDSNVIVKGTISGTVSIPYGAVMTIEPSGKLQGTLVNDGTVILKGVFGGQQSGAGDLIIEDQGYIKQPVVKDGMTFYQW